MTVMIKNNKAPTIRRLRLFKDIYTYKGLYAMMAPGVIIMIVFSYLPMAGVIIAFKEYNPIKGVIRSKWIGLENFRVMFQTKDAIHATFNTLSYNVIFLVLGLGLALFAAILLKEVGGRRRESFYKSVMVFPNLLSWVVISYLLYGFLSMDKGIVNTLLKAFGIQPVMWYSEPTYWTAILTFAYLWKNVGYTCVIFIAGITGISQEYYEAAEIDGATKVQQTFHVTIPMLMPITMTLLLLQVGKFFTGGLGDWGLFYNLPNNSGILIGVSDVIDTYVFRALRVYSDFGMSSAVGLYQSAVGMALVLLTNLMLRKFDRESALF